MAAMLTSLYPSQLGLAESPTLAGQRFAWRERREQQGSVVPLHARTLAEVLLDAGFKTAAFVNQPALNVMNGFERGFTDWYYPIGSGEIVSLNRGAKHQKQEWGATLKVAAGNDRMLAQEFNRWLGQNDPEDQMFVWLHLLTPHLPYVPDPKFMPEFSATESRTSDSDRYDAEVRAVDEIVGDIVDAIEEHVGLERALIIFTADHGEAFGEHGMHEHGHTLHGEVMRVPLIMVSSRFAAGARMDDYVSTIDVVPTILDVIQKPELAPREIEGVTIVPRTFVHDAHPHVYAEGMLYGSTERAVVSGGYKLMFDEQDHRWTMYDLHADPEELIDITVGYPDTVHAMAKLLKDTHSRLAFWAESRGRPGEQSIDPSIDLDALRSLGYIDQDDSKR
jgi:arylsulfatase A-like enzyme